MSTDFDHHIRVLMCSQCGAPLDADVSGGMVTCGYCGVEHQIRPREPANSKAKSAVDEELRIQRLWAQEGRALPAPDQVARLLRRGQLTKASANTAIKLYNRTRAELEASSEHEASYLLTHVTLVLYNYFALVLKDPKRQRGLLESAVEAKLLPHHRQFILGILSRSAVMAGDLQAAKDWLADCDPHSMDLRADSAYRIGWALVATAEGNFTRVHELLGAGHKDVPISDGFPPMAAVLRANAWEKSGLVDMGRATLKDYLAEGSVYGLPALKTLVALYPDLALCAECML
ncbi:MAG: hypothetical protein KC912_14220 [Proteobacteria bacterium]|nr:hypothetical protein [Pseudomonadota bacterium]